ncbi:MAG: PKD domain-containing protein, partial [Pirellulales bacterium]|nr:PKD domain-containing protein [Pirellulales bacterium]
KGPYPEMLKPRYDVIYVRDQRGWYYRYSHLDSFDSSVKLGGRVAMGQRIGALGKKGASGGWTHLHFDVNRPQPSGRYGIDDAYAFVWQVYQQEHPTPLVAVARPHKVARPGDPVVLDASRSYSVLGPESLRYEWTLTDGTTATGPRLTHRYGRPGNYREIVKVTDSAGRVDYDFARVFVLSATNPKRRPPNVHATYWPTFDVKPGDRVTFKVITRDIGAGEGREVWDFGDGTPTVATRSKPKPPTYATIHHTYEKPGHYLVRVERTNDRGETGADRLQIRVGP